MCLGDERLFYIGLSKEKGEDNYVWRDLSILRKDDYQNWQKRKKPPSRRVCIMIGENVGADSTYVWKPSNCMKNASFICEQAEVKSKNTFADCVNTAAFVVNDTIKYFIVLIQIALS